MVVNSPIALFVGTGIVAPVFWHNSKSAFILLQISLKDQLDMVFSSLFPLIHQHVLGLMLLSKPGAELGDFSIRMSIT